jgi:ATP-dependent helicase Lhr and Lhr-like helicase
MPVERPLDVLAQHLVTCALGGGFRAEAMLAEVRTTRAFRDLQDDEWEWTLDFVTRGGSALQAYPEFSRVVEATGCTPWRARGSRGCTGWRSGPSSATRR